MVEADLLLAKLASMDHAFDGWQLVYFFRPPECIPTDFDLLYALTFLVPSPLPRPDATECGPATIDGYAMWRGEPPPVPTLSNPPFAVESRGLGAVPVWFIPAEAWDAAIENDRVTIGELEESVQLRGTAHDFHEVSVGNAISVEMEGTLEDGTPFRALGKRTFSDGQVYVEIG